MPSLLLNICAFAFRCDYLSLSANTDEEASSDDISIISDSELATEFPPLSSISGIEKPSLDSTEIAEGFHRYPDEMPIIDDPPFENDIGTGSNSKSGVSNHSLKRDASNQSTLQGDSTFIAMFLWLIFSFFCMLLLLFMTANLMGDERPSTPNWTKVRQSLGYVMNTFDPKFSDTQPPTCNEITQFVTQLLERVGRLETQNRLLLQHAELTQARYTELRSKIRRFKKWNSAPVEKTTCNKCNISAESMCADSIFSNQNVVGKEHIQRKFVQDGKENQEKLNATDVQNYPNQNYFIVNEDLTSGVKFSDVDQDNDLFSSNIFRDSCYERYSNDCFIKGVEPPPDLVCKRRQIAEFDFADDEDSAADTKVPDFDDENRRRQLNDFRNSAEYRKYMLPEQEMIARRPYRDMHKWRDVKKQNKEEVISSRDSLVYYQKYKNREKWEKDQKNREKRDKKQKIEILRQKKIKEIMEKELNNIRRQEKFRESFQRDQKKLDKKIRDKKSSNDYDKKSNRIGKQPKSKNIWPTAYRSRCL